MLCAGSESSERRPAGYGLRGARLRARERPVVTAVRGSRDSQGGSSLFLSTSVSCIQLGCTVVPDECHSQTRTGGRTTRTSCASGTPRRGALTVVLSPRPKDPRGRVSAGDERDFQLPGIPLLTGELQLHDVGVAV